ncbi:MAG: hypothetical protein IK997_00890 [Bacilli bacterium]|nr:hypothetical protein [Bacilli bacterium]
MFRKTVNGDISDKDFKKILIPFNNNYDKFIEDYIMPEVIAFYIANSFYRDAMWKGSFKQHYNSAADVINFFNEDYEKVKIEVFKLLKIKYALEVINEEPLILKQIKY